MAAVCHKFSYEASVVYVSTGNTMIKRNEEKRRERTMIFDTIRTLAMTEPLTWNL